MTAPAAGESAGTPAGEGDTVRLPRRNFVLRSIEAWLVIASIGFVVCAGLAADGEVVGALGFGAYFVVALAGFAVMYLRWDANESLEIDTNGLASFDRDTLVVRTHWSNVVRVEFRSGDRFPQWQRGGGVYPAVLWWDDAPYDRWNPDRIAGSPTIAAIGRRPVMAVESAVRAACEQHGVPYQADWQWAWRVRLDPRAWL